MLPSASAMNYSPAYAQHRNIPGLGSADEQILRLRLLFGHCVHELGLLRSMPSVGCCKSLPLCPSQSYSQGLSPTDSPEIPIMQDRSRGSIKETYNAGVGGANCPSRVLFSLQKLKAQGTPLPLVLLAWGRSNVVSG